MPMAMIIDLTGKKPALCRLSRTVVMPKAARPSGPGFASFYSIVWATPDVESAGPSAQSNFACIPLEAVGI